MGESLVETPKVEYKMGETVTNISCLQQSVSFGRFEHDSLSWERWSTFPTNKYLEEVEKCSTPGSVARKKAYFEAHYKNIAARRAELLQDQEREREAELVNPDKSAAMSLVYNACEDEIDNEKADIESSANNIDQGGNQVCSSDGEIIVEHVLQNNDSAGIFSEWNDAGNIDGEVSVEHLHVESESYNEKADIENSANNIDQRENQVGGSDGEMIAEHVLVTNDSTGLFSEENDIENIDGEVSVEYVHVKNDTAGIVSQENELFSLHNDMSKHTDCTLKVDTNELDNLTSDKSEVFDEFKDGNNTFYEMSEVVRSEVTKDIGELNDGADVVDEVVEKEVIEFVDERDDGADIIKESDDHQEEIGNEVLSLTLNNPELGKLNESVSVTEDVPSVSEGLPQEKVKRTISEEERKNLTKFASPKKTQKATLVKKTTSTKYAKNKPASPILKRMTTNTPKSPMLSTPKSLKPELTKVTKSATPVLRKNENGVTPLTSKKRIGPQSKREVPTSLHMSLSLGSMNGDQGSLARKSLIMERMGDKDIVKRAFKAFQKTPETIPSSLVKPPSTNKSASTKAEPKGSPANILPKKNEGIGRAARTASTRTGQQVAKKALLSPGITKNVGVDQSNVKSVAVSFGPRVQLQGSNKKEASKKVELKTRTNVLEATHMQSKLKVEKASQVKNLSQSINSKPKLSLSNNSGLGGSLRKENGMSKVQASG